jgi:hypothetical protein
MKMTDRKKKVDNELIQQIKVLQSQIEDLQRYIRDQDIASIESVGIKFLLTEFRELGQLWRHTDSRIENAANLYLTICTILVPGIVLFYHFANDPRLFLIGVALAALALFVIGAVLVGRIIESRTIKVEYIYALNLIRGYFAEKDVSIVPYLYFPIEESPNDLNDKQIRSLHPRIYSSAFTHLINIWNGLLFGIAVAAVLWLFISSLSITTIVVVGGGAALICYSLLTLLAKRTFKNVRIH